MEVKRVIITGGPSTGKTSIINHLEKMDYNCSHEHSREIIKESLENNSDVLPWRDLMSFSKRVIDQREKQFHSARINKKSSFVFFDRGIPDIYAYMNYDKIDIPEDFMILGKELKYFDKVFITPAWEDIYETDEERREEFEKAKDLEMHIRNSYENLGYKVIAVPKTAIEKRVNFILDQL